jgi:hypothetical protein
MAMPAIDTRATAAVIPKPNRFMCPPCRAVMRDPSTGPVLWASNGAGVVVF